MFISPFPANFTASQRIDKLQTLSKRERSLRKTMPVIINSFNQPTYLLRLLLQLADNGFENLVVYDQASTSPDCVALLHSKIARSLCRVIFNKQNAGPRSFFYSEYYETLPNNFIFSDPDLELAEDLPLDFLSKFLDTAHNTKVGKIGCALRIDDSEDFEAREILFDGQRYDFLSWEMKFWQKEVSTDIYEAPTDTTMALYDKRLFDPRNFFPSLRIAGPYAVRHRPWYKDKRIPAKEWADYLGQTKHSFWFTHNDQSESGGGEPSSAGGG